MTWKALGGFPSPVVQRFSNYKQACVHWLIVELSCYCVDVVVHCRTRHMTPQYSHVFPTISSLSSLFSLLSSLFSLQRRRHHPPPSIESPPPTSSGSGVIVHHHDRALVTSSRHHGLPIDRVREICLYKTCWVYSSCNFQYRSIL